jgi:heme o synthase
MDAHVLAPAVALESRNLARDLVGLTKPRLSSLVLCTTAGGIWLAPGPLSWPRALMVIVATSLLVGAANALNSYIERHIDARMERTRHRPLAARRLHPRIALVFGLVLAAISLPVLAVAANPATALLGGLAYVSYVCLYTPLKQISTWALPVGAIPGAIPPALGYVSVTGELDQVALALFGVLFVWQLPHFIAISIYLKDDYAKGGLKVFALVHGDRRSLVAIISTAALLIPVTLTLVPLGVATPVYGVAAALLGAAFLGFAVTGLWAKDVARWSRRLFLASLVYLTLLLMALAGGTR